MHPAAAAETPNMRAEPAVTVEDRDGTGAFRAHEALGEESDRLWPMVIAAYPGYAEYQRRTERTIPLFVLEPA